MKKVQSRLCLLVSVLRQVLFMSSVKYFSWWFWVGRICRPNVSSRWNLSTLFFGSNRRTSIRVHEPTPKQQQAKPQNRPGFDRKKRSKNGKGMIRSNICSKEWKRYIVEVAKYDHGLCYHLVNGMNNSQISKACVAL